MQKELVHDNKAVMQKTALSRETYLLWEGYGAVVNQLWVRLSLHIDFPALGITIDDLNNTWQGGKPLPLCKDHQLIM